MRPCCENGILFSAFEKDETKPTMLPRAYEAIKHTKSVLTHERTYMRSGLHICLSLFTNSFAWNKSGMAFSFSGLGVQNFFIENYVTPPPPHAPFPYKLWLLRIIAWKNTPFLNTLTLDIDAVPCNRLSQIFLKLKPYGEHDIITSWAPNPYGGTNNYLKPATGPWSSSELHFYSNKLWRERNLGAFAFVSNSPVMELLHTTEILWRLNGYTRKFYKHDQGAFREALFLVLKNPCVNINEFIADDREFCREHRHLTCKDGCTIIHNHRSFEPNLNLTSNTIHGAVIRHGNSVCGTHAQIQ